ncbi:unnamed protein product [Acanthoscelides obtectus]|uniref:Nuclear receptor-binding factor 2 MIT domain-containing protein n=1 Tax=Acanthoscelides obtectus TaxID=200917 RepID=A0A9P0PL53_ACAOB|nr:unnamed protein product [Acanthoscelides obtectus]CAK1661146.1 Nuclear receptor-binding factor 2 [Acanthoscelides obtectus]
MIMESASLNKAHQQQRRAEALLRQKKFDECIECHRQAILLLNEASKMTENPRSLESIRLQKMYHEKQIDLMRAKKSQAQIEQYRKSHHLNRKISSNGECDNSEGLEATIYRTIQVHDSLIDYLGKRSGSDNDSLKSYSTSDTDDRQDKDCTTPIVGNKHPKDDSQIIEELKVLSGQLRDSVQCLLVQLDDRNKEIEKLKATINVLESEKQKASAKSSTNGSLKVTDSSGGTSPYVFSPCSELSPDVNEISSIPPLAPLEMPNLDFLSVMKSNNNNAN